MNQKYDKEYLYILNPYSQFLKIKHSCRQLKKKYESNCKIEFLQLVPFNLNIDCLNLQIDKESFLNNSLINDFNFGISNWVINNTNWGNMFSFKNTNFSIVPNKICFDFDINEFNLNIYETKDQGSCLTKKNTFDYNVLLNFKSDCFLVIDILNF